MRVDTRTALLRRWQSVRWALIAAGEEKLEKARFG